MTVRKLKYYEFYEGDEVIAAGSRGEIAEKIGLSISSLERYRRQTVKNRRLVEVGYILPVYAFYKGERFIASGTIYEIMKEVNISESTLLWYSNPSSQERTGDALIKIEGDYVIQKKSADRYAPKPTNDDHHRDFTGTKKTYRKVKAKKSEGKLDPYRQSLFENMFRRWN